MAELYDYFVAMRGFDEGQRPLLPVHGVPTDEHLAWMKALADHPEGSEMAKVVNAWFHYRDAARIKNAQAKGKISKKVRLLESAIDMAPPYRGPAFRGLVIRAVHPLYSVLSTPGQVLTTRSHSSWSDDESEAKEFSLWDHRHDRPLPGIVLRLPQGHRKLRDLRGVLPPDDLPHEGEVVLPKGSSVRVNRVEKDGEGNLRVELRHSHKPGDSLL
jgi:hypothetical protein